MEAARELRTQGLDAEQHVEAPDAARANGIAPRLKTQRDAGHRIDGDRDRRVLALLRLQATGGEHEGIAMEGHRDGVVRARARGHDGDRRVMRDVRRQGRVDVDGGNRARGRGVVAENHERDQHALRRLHTRDREHVTTDERLGGVAAVDRDRRGTGERVGGDLGRFARGAEGAERVVGCQLIGEDFETELHAERRGDEGFGRTGLLPITKERDVLGFGRGIENLSRSVSFVWMVRQIR